MKERTEDVKGRSMFGWNFNKNSLNNLLRPSNLIFGTAMSSLNMKNIGPLWEPTLMTSKINSMKLSNNFSKRSLTSLTLKTSTR